MKTSYTLNIIIGGDLPFQVFILHTAVRYGISFLTFDSARLVMVILFLLTDIIFYFLVLKMTAPYNYLVTSIGKVILFLIAIIIFYFLVLKITTPYYYLVASFGRVILILIGIIIFYLLVLKISTPYNARFGKCVHPPYATPDKVYELAAWVVAELYVQYLSSSHPPYTLKSQKIK
ncbi:hypothetical protein Lal_00049658 [Lupinus albus]|nr:hypothetical protein Lal_00049658 [Lupinus albus]